MNIGKFEKTFVDFKSFTETLKECKDEYNNQKLDLITAAEINCDLENLSVIDDCRLHINIDGIAVDGLFHKSQKPQLYVILSGGISKDTSVPHFERWTYHSILNGSVFIIDDPMLKVYQSQKLCVGWYYGLQNSYLESIRKIIVKMAAILSVDNENIVFYGSSAGGYAALYMVSKFEKSKCIAINPQINLKIQRSWVNAQEMEAITGHDLSSDDYRNDLRQMIAESNAGRIVIIENACSSTDIMQAKSFCDFLNVEFSYGLNKLSERILLWVYDALPIYNNTPPHGAQELRSQIYSILGLLDIDMNQFDSYKGIYLSISLMWSELYKKYRDCQFWIGKAENLEKTSASSVSQDILRRVMAIQDREYYQSKFNSISSVQTRAFARFKNIHQGQDIVLVATGPSMNSFKPIKHAIYCGVNKAFKSDLIMLNYLFIVDYNATKDYIEEAENYPCEKFYGLVRDKWEKCIIPESIVLKAGASRFYLEGIRNPVHYTLDICNEPIGDCGSVIFSAMQFLLWTNPRTIYLVGCDCTRAVYFDSTEREQNVKREVDKTFYDGWVAMKKFVEMNYPGTKIVSVNPVGLRGLFEDWDQNEQSGDMSR